MTKDQKKDVLARFVSGESAEAIAVALDMQLSDVQSAVQRETTPDAPAEPDPCLTPARIAQRAAAQQHLARLATERARIPNDLQRIEARDRRSEGGTRFYGGETAGIHTPDRRRF